MEMESPEGAFSEDWVEEEDDGGGEVEDDGGGEEGDDGGGEVEDVEDEEESYEEGVAVGVSESSDELELLVAESGEASSVEGGCVKRVE